MLELTRTVRFVIPLCGNQAENPFNGLPSGSNTFAGVPAVSGIGGFHEIDVAVRGLANQTTGYLINISHIDQAVRTVALPLIWELVQADPLVKPAAVLFQVLPVLQKHLGGMVTRLTWRLSPYHAQTMTASSPDLVSISQQFEFSASHRLNVATLTPQQNREIFGKCNNPNGHGHNYRIEPTVAVPINPPTGARPFTLHDLERIVNQTVIQRFDHKHLNLDTSEFAQLNPSVENIERVCHDLLRDPLAAAGATLQRVTIWETEKTRCTYPA